LDSAVPSFAFDLLDETVRRWVWEQNWTELRDIQEAAIRAILPGERDVILSAATASGKTEAAFLPILTRLVQEGQKNSVGALYVSPLKALINDQFRRLDLLCERLDIPVTRWHGDVDAGKKRALLRKPRGVLLITPESLEALFVLHGTKIGALFGGLAYVVVDELHAFLENERGRQLQSLLHRIEAATGSRRVPRIALSATLSDLRLAADFLRPGEGAAVETIVSHAAGAELRAQIRGYVCRPPVVSKDEEEDPAAAANAAIAAHLFQTLRGSHNLVFANSRNAVETFADALAGLSEHKRVANEFVPHHGNLGRDIREDTESRLKDRSRPATAVCTSTLEMGIDIGDMNAIAQIGPPPSVASLRQRVGRSGRRAGAPCRLRMYAREQQIDADTPLPDLLREETVQMIAQLRLLAEGWCEPPDEGAAGTAPHLSTLVQQTLSVIAERGGVRADPLWKLLAKNGPFQSVDQALFAEFLRALHDKRLISQMDDGTLLLGEVGERLVAHYSFYAAFATPEEWRLVADGRTLGTLPVEHPLIPDGLLVYAGRRWRVLTVDNEHRVVDLAPARGGRAPIFGGTDVWVHERIRETMLAFYHADEDLPPFLDAAARDLAQEGRDNFRRFGLDRKRIVASGAEDTLVFLWSGDRAAATLALELFRRGVKTHGDGVCLLLANTPEDSARALLQDVNAEGLADPLTLAALVPNLEREKYDHFLPPALLVRQYAARFVDTDGATRLVARVLAAD
jgi:ATP-dependent Lhr-like helicase